LLTRTTSKGRKCGNELVRKASLGNHHPAFEPTPEKDRVISPTISIPCFYGGPNGSSRPLVGHQTSYPRPGSGCTPGVSLSLSLSPLLSPLATEKGSFGKPQKNQDFGVMLDSDTVMISPAI